MKKTIVGANSALGNVTMSYDEGKTYDMNEEWSKDIALAWISMDIAEEVKAIKAFKKAGYKLVNDNKGGAGAERGHSKLFNITKFLTNWTESHRVTFNSKTIDTIKMIYQRLKKDKQSDIRYLLESFCLTVVFHMRKTNVESLYDQIYARHITDMKKLYPKYSMSID